MGGLGRPVGPRRSLVRGTQVRPHRGRAPERAVPPRHRAGLRRRPPHGATRPSCGRRLGQRSLPRRRTAPRPRAAPTSTTSSSPAVTSARGRSRPGTTSPCSARSSTTSTRRRSPTSCTAGTPAAHRGVTSRSVHHRPTVDAHVLDGDAVHDLARDLLGAPTVALVDALLPDRRLPGRCELTGAVRPSRRGARPPRHDDADQRAEHHVIGELGATRERGDRREAATGDRQVEEPDGQPGERTPRGRTATRQHGGEHGRPPARDRDVGDRARAGCCADRGACLRHASRRVRVAGWPRRAPSTAHRSVRRRARRRGRRSPRNDLPCG